MKSSSTLRHALLLGLAIVALRTLAQPAAPTTDSTLFDSNRVVNVEITLAPDDWEKLRNQERDAKAEFSKDRLERPAAKPYTWFTADVTIDGTKLKNVGVRKRGFFGSADKDRPALNLELDRFVKGQRFAGRSELKLHNNKQDGTSLRQALAYQLFTAAGVPAPRCNLARVTVNGTNLGVYSNLEPIDDAFLKHQFGSDQGNLYEAQISDFRPGWTRTFEKKNNKAAGREDLDAVVAALQSDDAQLLDRLGRVLDVDAFINFWAMESLINHWDGFAGDLNNCFVYHDPKSDKLRFIAWGADSTFGPHNIFVPFEPPASVWAVSFLTRRLYNHPITQQKYRARLQELLATVWNEQQLLAAVERMEKLTQGMSTTLPFLAGPEKAQLKQFIGARRNILEAELKQSAQPWTYPMRRELYTVVVGKVSVEFSSTWVPSVFAPAPAGAKAQVKLDFYGRQLVGNFTDVKAMPDIANPRNAAISLSGSFPGVDVPVALWVSTKTNLFQAGKTLTAGTADSVLLLVAGQFGQPNFRILGSWESGAVKLDQADQTAGGKVSGNIAAEISTT
ncbi:MAG TPA: hypothetical protein DCE44_08865, partial [Verrucomicrobiales bacterium]|nr:hypothetical protein [Verrucomicrobiales bacterium]